MVRAPISFLCCILTCVLPLQDEYKAHIEKLKKELQVAENNLKEAELKLVSFGYYYLSQAL